MCNEGANNNAGYQWHEERAVKEKRIDYNWNIDQSISEQRDVLKKIIKGFIVIAIDNKK